MIILRLKIVQLENIIYLSKNESKTMDSNQKYIARIMLKNRILQSDAQAYEDLFIKVMQNKNPNFQPIKPQGSYGDRKNDGFDKTTGTYYQVYAPENIKHKEKDTIDKLVTDFEGLYNYWNKQVTPIKQFVYVVNDKYKGTYPSLHPELAKIENTYEGVKTEVFLSKHLEDTCLELSDDKIIDIIGILPTPFLINDVEPSILNEVINFILQYESPYTEEAIPPDPNFDEKIQFNDLNVYIGGLLDMGRLQSHIVIKYFELNSNFTKDELRTKFNYFYEQSQKEITEEENNSDIIFFSILEKASPNKTKAVQDAVLVLMAHYFEYCDIFETPS